MCIFLFKNSETLAAVVSSVRTQGHGEGLIPVVRTILTPTAAVGISENGGGAPERGGEAAETRLVPSAAFPNPGQNPGT